MSAPVVAGLVIVGIFGILGYRDGVVRRVVEILGVFATIILTARFAAGVQPWIAERTGTDEGPALLITWAVLVIAGLLLSRLLAAGVSKIVRWTVLGWLDRAGGAVLGMALGALIASVLLVAASQVPGGGEIQARCQESNVGRLLYYAAPDFYRQARRLTGGRAEEVWNRALDGAREQGSEVRDRVEEAVDDARG